MLCDICGKNEANIYFTKIVNGNSENKNICKECAQNLSSINLDIDTSFSIDKFFTSIIDSLQDDIDSEKNLVCENCNTSYKDFKSSGLLGCSSCYDTFNKKLNPILKNIQGENFHRGKTPKNIESQKKEKRKIKLLNKKLSEAVYKEEYEKAAIYRDEIKKLKGDK